MTRHHLPAGNTWGKAYPAVRSPARSKQSDAAMKRLLQQASLTVLLVTATMAAQTTAAPRANGSVKSNTAGTLVVTTAKGDVTVSVGETAKVLEVPPGSTNLAAATPATVDSVAAGDKVLVTGTAGDDPSTLHAVRVVVMRSEKIASIHAAEDEAWQRGGGGLVKSVDPVAHTIAISAGTRNITVTTSPATSFKRYSGDSVRFADATASHFTDISAGDQLRVRGTRSEDGSTIAADAIVTGSFRNYSGLITAIDAKAGTITVSDLATKKPVVVKLSANSDLRRIPPQAAARFAARASGSPVGPAGTSPGSSGAAASGPGGQARAGMDLSQMLSRLPTETLGGLKAGDAVMIVATAAPADGGRATAVTLLVGVEPILQAAPSGDFTLSPWSMGSAPGGGGEGA